MIVGAVATKGGVGKTTLAVHLAGWLVDAGHGVVVVDADRQLCATRWLAEALPNLCVEAAHEPDDLLTVIPALAQATDYVIVDGPPGSTRVSRAILLVCNLALLPCGPSVLDLRSLRDTVQLAQRCQLDREGPPELLIILNKMRRRERASAEIIHAVTTIEVPVARTVIRQRAAFADLQIGVATRSAAYDMDLLFRDIIPRGRADRSGRRRLNLVSPSEPE